VLDPEIYRDAIEQRYKALVKIQIPSGLLASIFGSLAAWATEGSVADAAIAAMTDYVAKNPK